MSALTDNKAQMRFEKNVDGHVVFARYRYDGSTLYILHVEAPEALRGKGAAGAFMQELMEYLRVGGTKKVVPVCGYAAAWLARHKEFADLL